MDAYNYICAERNASHKTTTLSAKISTESQTKKTPDQILAQLNKLSDKMFKNE